MAWQGAALLLAGCGSEGTKQKPPAFEALVSPEVWTEVTREEDPFVADLAETPACVGNAFVLEEGVVELDTGRCAWVTLEQPALRAVTAGQQLSVIIGHYDLTAPAPSEGRVEIALGSCSAWSKIVAIPGAAAVYEETFESPCSIEMDDPVRFHLHNHGQNSWQLQQIAALR